MFKFYAFTWAYWATWLTLFSLLLASILSALLTSIHFFKSSAVLNGATLSALEDIFLFYLAFTWSFSFIIGLILSVKKLFVHCFDGYRLSLLSCDGTQEIRKPEVFGQSKLFRKYFFAIIWAVAVQMIVISAMSYFFAEGSFAWFNVYSLYLLVLSSGAIVLPLLGVRCKMMKVKRC